MENHQLICTQGQARESAPIVIRELDLEHIWSKQFHNGSHLPSAQLARGQVLGQRHDIKKFYSGAHFRIHL